MSINALLLDGLRQVLHRHREPTTTSRCCCSPIADERTALRAQRSEPDGDAKRPYRGTSSHHKCPGSRTMITALDPRQPRGAPRWTGLIASEGEHLKESYIFGGVGRLLLQQVGGAVWVGSGNWCSSCVSVSWRCDGIAWQGSSVGGIGCWVG